MTANEVRIFFLFLFLLGPGGTVHWPPSGGPKYEPFAQNGSWSAQSTNPVPKMPAGASKVPFEVKTICVNLWVARNYASTALLGGLARNVHALIRLANLGAPHT